MRPQRGPLSWALRTPPAPRRGHPCRPTEPSSCTTGHTQGLGRVQVSSLQGLRSSRGPGGHPFQKAALAPRKGASRTSPAERLSPPLADQLTWQHSFKGGQACKNEPSKALLTPTEAPVRSTPRAARPPPLWKRQGHDRAPRSLQSPHASLSARDGPSWRPLGRVLTLPVHTAERLGHLRPARPCPELASVTTPPQLDGQGGWAGSVAPTRLSSRALCCPTCGGI